MFDFLFAFSYWARYKMTLGLHQLIEANHVNDMTTTQLDESKIGFKLLVTVVTNWGMLSNLTRWCAPIFQEATLFFDFQITE